MSGADAGGFSFPLNVFARLLELETGRCDYLHYGLFVDPGQSVADAQSRSSALLRARLPAPCKLLEVGIGVGTLLNDLRTAGYDATGITPDGGQIAYAKARFGQDLPAIGCRLEDFSLAAGEWDCIVFQESGQYIPPLDLMAAARRLLRRGGELLLIDEFAMRRRGPGAEPLHHFEHFLRLAERCGFVLVEQVDLSAEAAPTVAWLRAALARQRDRLLDDPALSEAQLSGLDNALRDYAIWYGEGVFGYHLLRFRFDDARPWTPERIDALRAPAMMNLFGEVFGDPMSPALWHWKYGDGRGTGVGVRDRAGRLVGHVGGMFRRLSWFGAPALGVQCCDVAVASAQRGTLSRQGPFFLASATFLELEIGFGTPALVGFGFPNRRAFDLPARLGLYGDAGRVLEARWPAHLARPRLASRVEEIDPRWPDDRLDRLFGEAWAAMAPSLNDAVFGVRDAAYLRHRYLRHPEKTYRLLAVRSRWRGRLLGLVVVRPDPARPGDCELLDLVGDRRHFAELLAQSRRFAARLGAKRLYAWVSELALATLGDAAGLQVSDPDIVIPSNRWTAAPGAERADGRWWLLGGDTDFH